MLVLGCSGATTPETPTTPELPPTAEQAVVESVCTMHSGEETQTWRFENGSVVSLAIVGDAAGTALEQRFVRDDAGRVVQVEVQLVEGVGSGEARRQSVSYEPGPTPDVLDMRVQVGEESRTIRWTYDARGFPVSSQMGEQTTTCRYDEQGRVVARDDHRFDYRGDARIPHSMYDPEAARTVPVHRLYDAIAVPGPDGEAFALTDAARRWTGACVDVFFGSCSPASAPPAPTGQAELPQPEPLAARTTPEDVARVDLRCANPDPEAEDGCTFEIVHRVAHEDGALRGAAVIRLAEGPQGQESTHLAVARADGWWVGSQLADGPFNGNQMSGTLQFQTRDLELKQVVEGGDPELLLRYETEQTFTDLEEREHELEEQGAIVCVDLATSQQRCVRVAESIDETIDGERTQASAHIEFPGNGGMVVSEMEGRHERVPRQPLVVIDWLFEP